MLTHEQCHAGLGGAQGAAGEDGETDDHMRKNKTLWEEIVSADDGEASSSLLEWSGLSGIWNRYELWSDFDFMIDVADKAHHISIHRKMWDGGAPGCSGIWHTILTNDETALKKELRDLLAKLIWKNRGTIHERVREEKLAAEERARKQRRDEAATKKDLARKREMAIEKFKGWLELAGGLSIQREAKTAPSLPPNREVIASARKRLKSRRTMIYAAIESGNSVELWCQPYRIASCGGMPIPVPTDEPATLVARMRNCPKISTQEAGRLLYLRGASVCQVTSISAHLRPLELNTVQADKTWRAWKKRWVSQSQVI
jgi:hypothetical protein